MAWRAAMAGLEAAIGLCAALNAAYFLYRTATIEPLSRKLAAGVLAMLFLGSLAESVALLAWLWADGGEVVSAGGWMFARSLTFMGTGCVSALVLKVIGSGR